MHSSDRTFIRPALVLAIAVAWLALAGPAAADTARTAPTAKPPDAVAAGGYVGNDTCVTCHEDQGKNIGGSPHGRAANPRTPAANQGCESCHGPGQAHVDGGGDKTKIKTFKTLSARATSDLCTSCHNRGELAAWHGGVHDSRNMSCTSCHSVHAPKSEKTLLKAATQTETCATCHKTEASKVRRSAHMPVREGKMECTSCHNPHGSQNVRQLRAGYSVGESCTSCHAEKRGPYLWEHATGRDGCVTCHDPHGSPNERMLVAKQPMFCQRCHVASRHPATIYDTVQLANRSNKLVGRSCVTCHSNIHGSNHPSGFAFVR